MAISLEPCQPGNVWDSALELTKLAQERNENPATWAAHLASYLCSAQVAFPSPELAHLLVSHICFDNHSPITWKLLEKSISSNLAPPFVVLALLSHRVIPNRRVHPAAYRLYMELLRRHVLSSSLSAQTMGPHYDKIMKSIDEITGLSRIFDLKVRDPGILLVAFVFSMVWQVVDASLDDESLLQHTPEKESLWLAGDQNMETSGDRDFPSKGFEKLIKANTAMAIELLAEFLESKVTSRIIFLARRNFASRWKSFAQRVALLASHSSALRSSKIAGSEALLLLISDDRSLLSGEVKTMSKRGLHEGLSLCSLVTSGDQSHGSRSGLWIPIDIFLEDVMDGSQVAVTGAIKRLIGLVKALRSINATSWHDAFLGLWVAALRLVHRERDPYEGPVPRIETGLCLLLTITTLAVSCIVEEEEFIGRDEHDDIPTSRAKQSKTRAGLVSSLQHLGDFDNLLTPPQYVCSLANQAAAKAVMFLSGIPPSTFSEAPINHYGNLRHLIVESCIARNVLDTSAYFWPGYVKPRANHLPRPVNVQSPGWSSLMKGAPLSPSLVSILVASPASSLPEVQKIYDVAVHGSDEEKIMAASVLCGASLARGWNIQEHTLLFIINLLCPPIPPDFSGNESHLVRHGPLLNFLVINISSADCVQIYSLHGLVPILATALLPICEVFGSLQYFSWTLPTGEELTSHSVFSNAFTLLLRLWRFDKAPLEHVTDDVPPVGTQLSPEFLMLVRNRQLATVKASPNTHGRSRRYSKTLDISLEPMSMESFPNLKKWYRQHIECAASAVSAGAAVHQIVDALLNMMFRKINKSASHPLTPSASGSSSSSGSASDDAHLLKIPPWDILEACPFALDAALTACSHGKLFPRELATGLKDLADFLPASLAAIVRYFSAEVTRGVWKPAPMNGTDWPSPAANLAAVEQQIKKILAATGVDVPSLSEGGSSQSTLPLPLAAFVSLTITYKLEKSSQRFLVLVGPYLNALAASCPWPCLPIVSALWVQKVKRWSDYFIFSASRTVFHHNHDAVVQLLQSCFATTLGNNGGVGGLLGHGIASQISGGMLPVAPGILYLRVHRSVRNVMFLTEEILSILMQSVRKFANDNNLPKETAEKLKKTKNGFRHQQSSFAGALEKVKLAAALAATLVWISGGLSLVQSLIKEILPSWFISAEEDGGGVEAMLGGYALAYMAVMCGSFAWGIDSVSPASRRRAGALHAHLEYLASALDGKISLGCNVAITQAYVVGFLSLMVASAPKWLGEVDTPLLKRLSRGLRRWNEDDLALSLLCLGGLPAMGSAAELIVEME